MGKYKHEGKGRNISIGGGKERSDLFKDMSGGYNAMGDSNKPSPIYNYGGNSAAKRYSTPMKKYGPLHGNAFGHAMQKAGGDYDKAKSMLEMKGSHSPMYGYASDDQRKAVHAGKADGGKGNPNNMMGDPNKKMDRLSARHKSLYDRFEMGQTSEGEEQRMFRLEDRMDKVGKKITKSKKSPLNQGKKIKKAKKTQAQIDKIRKSFGTKDADVSGRFDRKRNKMDKTVKQLERKGIRVDFDTTSAEGEGSSRKTLYYKRRIKKSPLNQGLKEMSKAELLKMLKRDKGIKPGDIKSKSKKNIILEKPIDKKNKGTVKSKNKKVIKATKRKMTTARGKTTQTPLNQGTRSSKRQSRPDVSTLGEKEFENKLRKERRLPGFAERPGDTQLQESAKKRTSDPDYKKPKAKTLKKNK